MEKLPKQNSNGELGVNKMPDHFKAIIREKMKGYSGFMDPVMSRLEASDAIMEEMIWKVILISQSN